LIVASRNASKLRELSALLPWRLEALDEDGYPDEGSDSYYENARAKAAYALEVRPGAWTLGEDSGIEVAALGGGPGVRSARYGKDEGMRAVARLLRDLDGVEDRRARYLCELVLLGPGGEELRGTGLLTGRISTEPRGSEGFGYDPVFIPQGEDRTAAELGNSWKAENSHRARAAEELLRQARGLVEIGAPPVG
jgi:XTP/dITP diphosphohydrolase